MFRFATAIVAVFLCSCGPEEKKPPRLSSNVEDCRAGKVCEPIKKIPAVEARMYGLTGLLGRAMNFSTGVDTAMNAVRKSYPTVKTYPRTHWQKRSVYATAKANYLKTKEPVILSGHSMGADAIVDIAHWLQADGIPVAAMFIYDPTPLVSCVPSNVQVAIVWSNTYPLQLGGGHTNWCVKPPKGSPRSLQAYDVPDFHTNIDDRPDVRAATVKHVGDVIHMLREMRGQ